MPSLNICSPTSAAAACSQKNSDAWLATYTLKAKQFELGGKLLASSHAEIRARTAIRFAEPQLHAQLLSRTVLG
jgi:putative hydrolase of HD superfamily